MIENEEIPEAKAIPITPNPAAVTLYGNQDAMDDFPVLKAFQQYVDSEQAKAHKRLMSVCFFFTMLIVVIIGVFLFVVMNMRNNAMTDGSAEIQKHILEQTAKMNDRLIQQLLANNNTPTSTPASVVVVGDNNEKPISKSLEAKERELAQREAELKKRELEEAQKELLAREKALKDRESKMAAELAEKEKKNSEFKANEQRQKEILEHRRRLYPEYFDENGNELKNPIKKNNNTNTFESREAEIQRLRQEAEIAKLRAEMELLKEASKKPSRQTISKTDDDDLLELEAILNDSGIYGSKKTSKSEKKEDTLSDVLNIDISGDGSNWTIPME